MRGAGPVRFYAATPSRRGAVARGGGRHLNALFVFILLGVAALFLSAPSTAADALDGVPLDLRAQLAVAASVYPPAAAPALDPESASFSPAAAAQYLETVEDGVYGASTYDGNYQVSIFLLGFADEASAAAGLEAWKATGEPPVPFDWQGPFAAFRRGQGLLGVSMLGAGSVVRGHKGPWHFEVSVTPQGSTPGTETGPAELAVAAAALNTIVGNAVRYRIFPRELTVEYIVAGVAKRLARGEPFQVPLAAAAETVARFSLQVVEGTTPVPNVTYRLELTGPLASLAELEQEGSRVRRVTVDGNSLDGAPFEVTFVFPPATSVELARLIDQGDTAMALAIEARPAPMVLP